ncbi:aldo/keto reductase [Isoptericola sp. b408]|uniref:aldo/keto reductase n=1 Tax=Isoptericola sp. b408 TaxID=3064653 RepID=UPI002712CFFE|nr:aldo/keto reductase [Isoptericola sp. b408]MDO8149994.1 aldo/keto reductase [Isoptericola sp. b408]
MQYRTLGHTGIQVSSLALGTMNFGKIGGTTQAEVDTLVGTALDAGINLVDTADVYSGGESEELLGKALVGRRDDVVLATKAGLPMGDGAGQRGASRRWLTTALDASLRRLGVDHVDLFQIHRWDPATSDEETLAALSDLQRAGKIHHFGTSTYPAYRMVQAQWAAAEAKTGRFVTEQPSYSILQRGVERDVLPVAQEYGLGVMVWSPLASGWLSGAVRRDQEVTTHRAAFMPQRFDLADRANQARMDAVEQLATVAEEAGLTLIQLALGFVTAHPGVTSALIGPRTPDHLASQLAAAETVLTAEVLDAIDAIVPPGTDLAAHEKNDAPPALQDAALRRR